MIHTTFRVIAVLMVVAATLTLSNAARAFETPTGDCVLFYKDADYGPKTPQGEWKVCENSINFPSLSSAWNDSISSIYVPPGERITIYEHASYGGKCRRVRGGESQADLGAIGANDQMSSAMINPSEFRWLRCL